MMKKISISICFINILLLILLMNNITHLNDLKSKGINNDKTKGYNNIAYSEYLPNNDILYICNDDGTISTTEDEMIEHLEKHLQENLPGDGSYHTEYKNVQTGSNTIPSWNY